MSISDCDKVIDFHTPQDFQGESFFIPDYQRGYRWTKQEIEDLLNDIYKFKNDYPNDSYSMQPVVVRKVGNKWEVIDGQQRLTSILIILQAFGISSFYTIDYAVLKNSETYVANIKDAPCEDINDDINLWHMKNAFIASSAWIERNLSEKEERDAFIHYVLINLKFLWYRTDLIDSDKSSGEQIFQRLNIGKIELTQSELIKALFLSRGLFIKETVDRRTEIAAQWDEFESMFQNDEFWYFLSDKEGSGSINRIEFLLRLLVRVYGDEYFDKELINGIDTKDGLFRIYYELFTNKPNTLLTIWDKATDIMDILRYWYDDVSFYHLIGFRIFERKKRLEDLLTDWHKRTIPEFRKTLADDIIKANPLDITRIYGHYTKSGEWKDEKGMAKNLLLLANVIHVLRQNMSHEQNADYAQGIFYKFPFHLFKKQIKGKGKGWDVEHIASATHNDLDSYKDQMEWICASYMALTTDSRSKFKQSNYTLLSTFFDNGSEDNDKQSAFESLYKSFSESLGYGTITEMTREQKNQITNFALLDYSTNRIYKNAIFPTKRQHIRNKEIGMLITMEWDRIEGEIVEKKNKAESAFVPPCTKDVFTKSYSNIVADSLQWSTDDARDYGKYLEDLFIWFKNQKWQ